MRIPFRGVAAFVLIWVILSVVPTFRYQMLRGWQPRAVHPWFFPLSGQDIDSALKAAPNDAFLQSQRLQSEWRAKSPADDARFFRDYDALIARHPHDVQLRRNRARLSTRGSIVSYKYTKQFSHWSHTGPPVQIWLPASELEKVAVAARSAQKVAPDDAFFCWMEGMALWGLGREDESVAALERAGRCRDFNDGSLDEARQKVEFLGRRRWMEWNDKLGVLWSALLPHFAGMRQLEREVAYSGVSRFRAGDKKEAWRRWGVALSAGQALRKSQTRGQGSTAIGLLVAESIEQEAWSIAAEEAGGYDFRWSAVGDTSEESNQQIRESLAAFGRAAKRDGYDTLARQVALDGQEILARRQSLDLRYSPIDFKGQIAWKKPVALAMIQMDWVANHASLWALIGVGGWFCALLLSRGGRNAHVGDSTVALLSAFFGVLWLGLGVVAVLDNAGLDNNTSIFSFTSDGVPTSLLTWGVDWERGFWGAVAATAMLVVLAREWGVRRSAKAASTTADKSRGRTLDSWTLIAVALWVLALMLSLALYFDGRNGFAFDGAATALWISWAASLVTGVGAAWQSQRARDAKGDTARFALNAAMALALFVFSSKAVNSDFLAWACIVLCPLTFVFWIWNGRRGVWSLRRVVTNTETGGRVLANVSLVIAFGYLVASVALLPARNQINAQVDSYIQMGEMDWLRAQGR